MINDESQGGQLELPRHELIRVPPVDGTSPSEKADEWYCPTCGRRIIIEYPPAYKKIVLVEGDQSVTHSGGKGGVEINPSQVSDLDPYLDIWQEWMDNVDFESHWESDLQ